MDHITLLRTDSQNADFTALVTALDADLDSRNGENQAVYNQYNTVDAIKQVVIAYCNGQPAGCGAIKDFEPGTTEVKRLFVKHEFRGKGIAADILDELERWAQQLGHQELILETGIAQHEAINLYQKKGYHIIDNYGQYAGMENSICFKKAIISL